MARKTISGLIEFPWGRDGYSRPDGTELTLEHICARPKSAARAGASDR
uniref:Uncharacterized protein n=1 Tax=Candidatus Nitrotoga fabula TaxID=2182327 RepID=A0A2X0SF65_9PROT|nr:protein of unknown function [Candidatus Nitrotoga fabula]